jgi:hypothetical protein
MSQGFSHHQFFITMMVVASGFTGAYGQATNIAIGNTILQSPVKRFGINLGGPNNYDSGQMMKNLLFSNPGFEAEVYQSTVQCFSGTATTCTDSNLYSGWPTGFWNGATFEFFYGTAQGRTGTVSSYASATGSSGGVFTFSTSGAAPSNGDYMIVRMTVPGNAAAGWSTYAYGAGSVGTNFSDLPPGTTGKQTATLSAPAANDSAALISYFDSTSGHSFVTLNGSFQLSFQAKGVGGNNSLIVNLMRYGVGTYLSQNVTLTNSWATYTLPFSAAEVAGTAGTVQLTLSAIGPDSVYLDNVSLTQLNTSPGNATAFRDPVVQTLQALNPGVIRFWADQLGDTLDNLLADPFGKQRAGYSAWKSEIDYIWYSLPQFLQLCQTVGADPWIVVPITFSATDAANLIEYLAGSASTPYGAKRAAAGFATPWTSIFSKIHLEFGNEAWNSALEGGTILYSAPYGQRAQSIFAAMRADASYLPSSFDLVLGGQASSSGRNQGIQNSCNNNDSFAVAPYMMNTVDSYSTNADLFGSTFAEPEAYESPSGTAEGVSGGLMLQNQQAIQASSHPVPLVGYEMNMSTLYGGISQAALNGYTSSLGAGLAVVDSMLQQLRQGLLIQNLFALPQFQYVRPDGKTVYLWGSVIDMGVTNRRRPQYLALQLANQAIGSKTTMLQTVHTGADPTWNQSMFNSVQLATAHYLQSFAFSSGNTYSLTVFNLNLTSSLPVTFNGANAPSGTVQMTQLTSSQPSDTNETANVVAPVTSTLQNFNPATGLSLPPYSMTVLSWTAAANPSPLLSVISSSNISSTGATITWTTDQPSTSQVEYGPTSSYGILSTANSSLLTSHSVILSGLTPGTTYDYAVLSANSAGQSSASGNYTFTTPSVPPPVILSVTITSITSNSATISWTTDQASTSQVEYGTTPAYGLLSAANSSLVTSHSVTLTGLTPNTTYNYATLSANSWGVSGASTNYTFTTQVPPPVISSVNVTGITTNSATITWTTDQASTSQVEFGTTTSYGSLSAANSAQVTSHSITLVSLTAGTTYDFAALSTNSSGLLGTSSNYTFTTTPPAAVITSLSVSGITSTGATITWTTDQPATSQVEYGTTSSYGSLSTANSSLVTSHTVVLSSLTPATTYNYAALSTNASGTLTTSANLIFSTPSVQLPAVISSVAASGITSNSATITWTTDQPATSQVEFGTTAAYGSLSTASNAMVTSHSITISGLTPSTTYDYAALSTNAQALLTTSSNFTFSTSSGANPAPPVISAVTATAITSTSVTITWTTDQPSTSQVEFGTTTGYGALSTASNTLVTSHSVVISGLASSTTYDYAVLSANAQALLSTSTNFVFVTTAATTAPVISGVSATSITSSSATITWTTDQPSTSQVEFGATTSYGSLSTASNTLVTSHSVVIPGLSPNTTYDYAVLSTNAQGLLTTSTNFVFTTTTALTAPVISAVSATAVTASSATITWTTDQASTSQVEFGTTTAYGSLSTASNTLVTSHSVVISGLSPNTTYDYVALSTNSQGLLATSTNFVFTTTQVAAPVISSVSVTGITTTTATINWTTDQTATSQVEYGTSTAYGSLSAGNNSLVTAHSVSLTSLTPGTTYNFAAISANSAGTSATSSNFVFATSPLPAPVITSVTSTLVTTTATVTWTTDQASTSQIEYGTSSAYGSLSALNSSLVTTHSVTLSGLAPGTTFNFAALSANAAGTLATSGNFTFTTPALPAPVISSVIVTSITSTSAVISWTTDQSSTSQVQYGTTTAYGTTSMLNSSLVTTHSITINGLIPATTYDFAVSSANAAGASATSSNFAFTTTPASAPIIPSVGVTSLTPNSAVVNWTTDQASTSQVEFGITASYGSLSAASNSLVTAHSVILSALNPGTTYYYAALSTNASGTLATSATFSFTTPAAAPVIYSLSASSVGANTATITWLTDQASSSQVEYGTTSSYGSYSPANSSLVTSHSITLTGVSPGVTYYYAALSANAAGVLATSGTFSFTTQSSGPVISSMNVSAISANSATVNWTTDQPSTSQVEFGTTTAYGSLSSASGTLVTSHSVVLSGLTPGTTYDFAVFSANANWNLTTSSNFTLTTATGANMTPPVISSMGATAITGTTATITWTTDQPSTSQVEYGMTTNYGSLSSASASLVTSHSVVLSGLTPGTTYNYAAFSANVNWVLATSANFTFTTASQ